MQLSCMWWLYSCSMRQMPAMMRLIACTLIASLLCVATAPAWHFHAHPAHDHTHALDDADHSCGSDSDHDSDHHSDDHPASPHREPVKHTDHDCAICIVMGTPLGGTPPLAPMWFAVALRTPTPSAPCAAVPLIDSGPVLFPCGPPLA